MRVTISSEPCRVIKNDKVKIFACLHIKGLRVVDLLNFAAVKGFDDYMPCPIKNNKHPKYSRAWVATYCKSLLFFATQIFL